MAVSIGLRASPFNPENFGIHSPEILCYDFGMWHISGLSLIALLAAAVVFSAPAPSLAQEQKPGQPLYLPGDQYHEHQSDLAPHTDPYWRRFQQQQQQRIQQGKPPENPYDNPTETIYERTERYEVVDEPAKAAKPPSRWGQ